jgi:putative hydrolase of the HAD superfamily
MRRVTAQYVTDAMVNAVLFDWGHTLMDWQWDDELLAAGHEAGLRAIGRENAELTARFKEAYEPLFWASGTIEELEYPGLVRRLLGDVGIDVTDEELDRFLEAEHAAWAPARVLGSTTHALLEALRKRGLKLGVVSNAFDPPPLLHRDLADAGITERIDYAVFSSEVGRRKPDAAIFQRALDALAVPAEAAVFVGDRLYEDVRGAAELGMATIQALWFRADDHPDGVEPDFQAFTQMDVLNVVRRLTGE